MKPTVQLYREQWKKSPLVQIQDASILEYSIEILPDDLGVSRILLQILSEKGVKAKIVDQLSLGTRALLDLRFLSCHSDSHVSLFETTKQLCSQEPVMYFVCLNSTLNIQADDVAQVAICGAPALVKTLRKEHPSVLAKAISLDLSDMSLSQIASNIAGEILAGGFTDEHVKYEKINTRYTASLVEDFDEELPDGVTWKPLKQNSVIVVSGGGRGVTAKSLISLAQTQKYKFLILGRSPLLDHDPSPESKSLTELISFLFKESRSYGKTLSPKDINIKAKKIQANREIRNTILTLENLGSEAVYQACDILDASSVRNACDIAYKKWGSIDALVHGAGVLADKSIVDKDLKDFAFVYKTKVIGFLNLLSACNLEKLQHICVFSSVAGRMGNAGQSDYAIANEVLTQMCIALQEKYPKKLCRSIAWGPWDGGMVDESLRQHFKQNGIALIPLEEGSLHFVNLFQKQSRNVEFVVGGLLSNSHDSIANSQTNLVTHISEQSHPYLNSHRVHNKVVVPIVLLAEWVARATGREGAVTWKNMQVRKGIVIDDFKKGVWLKFKMAEVEDGDLVEVWCQGMLRFQACLKDSLLDPKSQKLLSENDKPWNRAASPYHDTLFHGNDFQVIENLESFGEGSCSANLKTDDSLDGSREHWITNSAVLDGGLQVAVTWFKDQTEFQALPTEMGSLEVYDKPTFNSKTRCILKVKKLSKLKSTWDIDYVSEEGDIQARVRDLSIHAVPSGY